MPDDRTSRLLEGLERHIATLDLPDEPDPPSWQAHLTRLLRDVQWVEPAVVERRGPTSPLVEHGHRWVNRAGGYHWSNPAAGSYRSGDWIEAR